MKTIILIAISIASLGLSAPKMLSKEEVVKDMAVSMWVRTELKSSGVSILDVGCGNGMLMPKMVEYFERVLGIRVDKIMGIDIGTWRVERANGKKLVEYWNEKLRKEHGERYSIRHLDIEDIRVLGHKFNFVFYVAPYPANEIVKRVQQIMKVMKDDGIMIIVPHLGELENIEESLEDAGISFDKSEISVVSNFPIEKKAIVIKRSEIRDSRTAIIFSGLLVKRVLEIAA